MRKISIYTTPELSSDIEAIIATENRLNELVTISPFDDKEECDYSIIVEGSIIQTFPLWDSTKPPILLPEKISYNKSELLGCIFHLLGNYEKAHFYFSNNEVLKLYAEICSTLLVGEAVELESLISFAETFEKDHTALHNLAIVNQYANPNISFEEINTLYINALSFDKISLERLAYTAKQYATFLADATLYNESIAVLEKYKDSESLSAIAKTNILAFTSHLIIKSLPQPYNQSSVNQIKSDLSQCIKQLREHAQPIDEAFVLMDASYVAMVDQKFSEALSYIQRAINLFEDGEIYELAANARLQKSDLLFTWAQQGNPQFYKAAMTACLEALEIFKRELTPDIFADIHHKLGVIYSEMLDEEKKRSIWTGVSISSFKEALNFFNKDDYPYEYALICHNQANAYTKYPQTIHSDNYAKALDWYNLSLEIRSADIYPNERAITLLNYLEAAWNLHIESDFDENLYNDMLLKAEEVKGLNTNKEFISEADRHISQLKELAVSLKL